MPLHVQIQQVTKAYDTDSGQAVNALEDVALSIGDGEFICLLGPSGCGKSTLLKLMAGIEPPTSGSVTVGGREVKGPSPERGVIFQDYALFPWLTVRDNIGFGLAFKRMGKGTRTKTVDHYMRLLELEQAARLYPKELSGGMQQRVAIARALCLKPQLLLLDEPFAALDAILRNKLQQEIVRIWQQEQKTFVLVTHDVEEAIYLADRIVVMSPAPGTIKQVVTVPLPRPRARTESGFVALRDRLIRLLLESDQRKQTGDQAGIPVGSLP